MHVVPPPPVENARCQRVGTLHPPCQSHLYGHNTLPQITPPKPGYWLKSSWFTLPKEPKLLPPPYGDQRRQHQDISKFSQDFWQIWNHSWDMQIRWEETRQDSCDAMKEWANPYLGCHLLRYACMHHLKYLCTAGQAAGRCCGRLTSQTGDQIC